ncbi:MAG: hypothetical protein ACRCUT_09200 [Spirochaetota bacterium]
MKKVTGFIAALILAFGVSAFAQTTDSDTTKKRTESYGEKSPADKGQQGNTVREQQRLETQAGEKEKKEQKQEQKKEKKQSKKEAKEQKKELMEQKKEQKQQGSGNKGNAD